MRKPVQKLSLSGAIALAVATAVCAQEPTPGPVPPAPPPAPNGPAKPTAPAPAAPAAVPAPAPTPPGQPKPYKEVLKDAKAIPGYFTLHQKDEKVWIEIKADQFDKPFFFSGNIPRSIGERMLYGGQMGHSHFGAPFAGSHMAKWKKIGNQVQLIAMNTAYFAKEGTPQAQFVSESFSDSLIASAPVAAAAHPDTKAVVVEANALLFGDILGYGTTIERAFRMPFALDARNTSVSRVTNTDTVTSVQVNAHFAVPKISPPPLTPSPVPMPPPPKATPDPRSFFVGFQYNFMPLPAEPMRARPADERLGHFTVDRVDYTEDTSPKLKSYIVTRWRLEKKDPAAALSEPKQPVTYWIDKNIPEKYRASVKAGILEWNKAFEKIGYKDAIVVKQQTDKDAFDTMDSGHASVRWFTGADVGFAIGPSHVDPRSGEILDADIGMSDVFGRGARRLRAEDTAHPLEVATTPRAETIAESMGYRRGFLACNYLGESAQQLEFAMDLLEARGLDMSSPEAEEIAQAYVKDVVMHEVGHTLGFQHNFRASSVYTLKQIQDPAFTKANGITTSVMDYTPFNLAVKGEKQGEYSQSTLGPYDYWAVEYAYKEVPAEREKEELARIAARSTEPLLAFANDYDAGSGPYLGIDPEVNLFDLGSDPLAFYKRRLTLSRELWDRLQSMTLATGESYERYTRSFANGFAQLARVAPLAAKYVGGVKMVRDRAGTGRPLYEPTPVAKQREALAMITNDLLRPDSFRFKPEFVSRIGIDHFERPRNPDVSIAGAVLNVQKAVLDQLMADAVATRLLDSQDKVADKAKAMRLSEVYDTVQGAVWTELKAGGDISGMRRNLQREHLRRVSTALIRPSATTPADARALQRENAVELQQQIRSALAKGGQSKEARAHLNESLNTLSEALKAPMQRAGA
ncbi:MAG: zinc-dependent metalloprotease [Betaproteobacteria bacterium]|nr:zinc-dependent metalloprotease [Betaproteobacteria bacterium]